MPCDNPFVSDIFLAMACELRGYRYCRLCDLPVSELACLPQSAGARDEVPFDCRYIKKVQPTQCKVTIHGDTNCPAAIVAPQTEPLTCTTQSPLVEHPTERLSNGSRVTDLSDTLLRTGSNEDIEVRSTPMQQLRGSHDGAV